MQRPSVQTRQVLPILAERGIQVSRGSLAQMSDLLGLQARAAVANWSHRTWTPAEAELLVLAFELRRRWKLPPEVLQQLMGPKGSDVARGVMANLASTLESFVGHAGAIAEEQQAWELAPTAQLGASTTQHRREEVA